MNLVSVSRIWLLVLAVCFGFSKTWLFDLSAFDTDSGFSFETDSSKNKTSIKPIHLSSNWRKHEKMLAKREKREVCRWHFVNRLANHFSHLAFRRSCQAIDRYFHKTSRRTIRHMQHIPKSLYTYKKFCTVLIILSTNFLGFWRRRSRSFVKLLFPIAQKRTRNFVFSNCSFVFLNGGICRLPSQHFL